jgi:hypothetical protein
VFIVETTTSQPASSVIAAAMDEPKAISNKTKASLGAFCLEEFELNRFIER